MQESWEQARARCGTEPSRKKLKSLLERHLLRHLRVLCKSGAERHHVAPGGRFWSDAMPKQAENGRLDKHLTGNLLACRCLALQLSEHVT